MTATLRPAPAAARSGGVSVLAGDDVREAAVVHLEELLPQLPSLSWAGASSRPRYFQLRGIGELEQYQGAPNPSVGFLVDEIDFSGIGMIASRLNVPVVPVRIAGLDKVLHSTWRMAKPGRVRVAFGAPLSLTGEDYQGLARRVEDAVRALPPPAE